MGNQHGTGFGSKSTTDHVARDISLVGKNALVTGANTGLGKETARILAKMGAHVIMGCRNMEKGSAAKAYIENAVENAQLTLLHLDLSNLTQIEEFVEQFNELGLPLHILINNAGIMATPFRKTVNGFESQFGTNHLGHFHLTKLLLPRLKEGQPSRVVCLASVGHSFSGINWSDISGENTWYSGGIYSRYKAYGQSKTANILFPIELNRRMHQEGLNITANAVHPGVIQTELVRDVGALDGLAVKMAAPFSKSIPQGAATTVYVATAPELEGIGGKYFADCNEAIPKAFASNPRYAARLWELSEQMIANAPRANNEEEEEQKNEPEESPSNEEQPKEEQPDKNEVEEIQMEASL